MISCAPRGFGPLIKVLDEGSVLLVDELDNSLHPALVSTLVQLFQSKYSNPKCAQIVFSSHDASLLGDSHYRLLSRDQIWFTEKLQDGSTRLFPLTDVNPRKQEAISRRYLEGRYGAVPLISRRSIEDAIAPIPGATLPTVGVYAETDLQQSHQV